MAARAEIDPAAIAHNVAALRGCVGDAAIAAVVKADGYGHGAPTVAQAALGAGATWLAVATPGEAIELVGAGIPASVPLLVLSEPPSADLRDCAADLPAGARLTVASTEGLAAIEDAGLGRVVPVHLEVDTGMHRMGVAPDAAPGLARAVVESPAVVLEGTWTHFANADRPGDAFTAEQISRFDAVVAGLRADGIDPGVVHLANSAGAISHPAARRDLVRLGIAIYGVAPDPSLEGAVDLRPALRLSTPVTAVRDVEPGESVSYGRRWFASIATRVATAGVGYADGIRRDSPTVGVEVLVRGRRRPLLGVVTMDQLMFDAGDDVEVGDEVVLIGRQGGEEITVNEVAGRLGTIGYEVLTSLGGRIVRRVVG